MSCRAGAVLVALSLVACSSTDQVGPRDGDLSRQEALELAVELANDECERLYSTRPFARNTFPIALRNGRWSWGRLDLAGVDGYSAIVTFRSNGKDREVRVFWTTDEFR